MNFRQIRDHLKTVGYGRLDPFDISVPTIGAAVRRIAQLRGDAALQDLANKPKVAQVDAIVHSAITIAQRQLARFEAQESRGKLDIQRFSTFVKTLEKLRAQAETAERRPAAEPGPTSKGGPEPKPADELDWLEPPSEAKDEPRIGAYRVPKNGQPSRRLADPEPLTPTGIPDTEPSSTIAETTTEPTLTTAENATAAPIDAESANGLSLRDDRPIEVDDREPEATPLNPNP